jgi:hypothetical protein
VKSGKSGCCSHIGAKIEAARMRLESDFRGNLGRHFCELALDTASEHGSMAALLRRYSPSPYLCSSYLITFLLPLLVPVTNHNLLTIQFCCATVVNSIQAVFRGTKSAPRESKQDPSKIMSLRLKLY